MPKKIILFADGTGNAFSTRSSNVWRIFEALDTSSRDQIAYYIPGVGTESLWPLALLDSATGYGVPSNVRKLYRFLCWNWRPGDEIYMFGFSRGAFTIRTLIAMIASEGLIPTKIGDEPVSRAEMRRNALAAWRSYRAKGIPFYATPILLVSRPIRNFLLTVWRILRGHRRYAPDWINHAQAGTVVDEIKRQGRHGEKIDIKFVGLFDTVEAYGVPVEELRWAIDKLVWPISFSNRRMSAKVQIVRHALSLDDERRTFHPLRIDRVRRVQKNKLHALLSKASSRWRIDLPQQSIDGSPDRVREVWFAGVHSNVGGGYPDDELARVPLAWILNEAKVTDIEAEQAGKGGPILRFRDAAIEEFERTSSPFGTLHDSRAGVAAFYRYSPRTVEILRDDGDNLINDVVVHHSVVQRVLNGSDLYAPLTLPGDALVLTPSGGAKPILDYLQSETADGDLSLAQWKKSNKHFLEHASDLVWIRQLVYFLMLGAVLSLLLLPLWSDRIGDLIGDISDENVVGGLVEAVETVAPAYFEPYLEAFRSHPAFITSLVILAFLLYLLGNTLRDKIHDNVRQAWKPEVIRESQGSAWNPFYHFARFMRKIDTSAPWLGRGLLKTASGIAVAMVAAVSLAGVVVLLSRVKFNYELGDGRVCNATSAYSLRWVTAFDAVGEGSAASTIFKTNQPCWASGLAVEKGVAYRLTVDMQDPWFDQLVMTDVGGFESNTLDRKIFKTPLLRWPSAGWFQPIARIDDGGDVEWPLVPNDRSRSLPVDGIRCSRLPIRYDETEEFCAAHDAHGSEECKKARTELLKTLAWREPLPESERQAATLAWRNSKGKWKMRSGGGDAPCESPYPRNKLVSDFVAQKSGEVFLFVNDAMPLSWQGYDAYYKDNLGSAKITLQRVPLTTSAAAP